MFRLISKILLYTVIISLLAVSAAAAAYLKLLPKLVSHPKVITYAEKLANKYTGFDLTIENPKLVTSLSPEIDFSVEKLIMKNQSETLLDLKDIDSSVSFKEIFNKKIIINRLGADKIFADVNKVIAAFSKEEPQEQQDFDWNIDLFNSILYINKSFIIYNPEKNTTVELKADNISIDNTQNEKYLHFDFNADIIKNNKKVYVTFKDDNKIVIKDEKIYINNCPLTINNSKMFFDAVFNQDKTFEANIYARRFFIPDIIKFLLTDVVENNIRDVLQYLGKINGDIDFNFKITEKGFSGKIDVNRCSAFLTPLADMPVRLTAGEVIIKEKDIDLKNFKGFYDNKETNEIFFDGIVKDYMKTAAATVKMKSRLTSDFFDKYLSKIAGVNLSLKGICNSFIVVQTQGADADVSLFGKIAKGYDILVEGASLSPVNLDRALKADIHVKGDNLNIEEIKYYISKELTKESKGKIKPILTLDGDIRISDGRIWNLGFDIPNPLPSEFLNVLIGQKLFKGGKFSGNLKMLNPFDIPKIKGYMTADEIRIPSQRLFLKHGEINTDRDQIHIDANGKYRRCNYTFNGNILNELKFPVVVTSTSLTIDEVDIERIMQSFTAPSRPVEKINNIYTENSDEDTGDGEPFEFDFDNIIVQNAVVKILKGAYKEMEFANVEANMALKDSIFTMKSNRFEIAKGHSSTNIVCDLKKQLYNITLGIKDVDADIISTTLLALPKEISGKASGIIKLNTDDSLKLNGSIKFAIKDGTIQKIGLVEYVLKFAALFRNPFAMISPGVFTDLVNIPDGNFDKITGELTMKNNIIEMMKIKSYSPYLSAFIIGSYNMENCDAILRIYTKFSSSKKGFAGFLRNLSLNSLANRIPLNSRNDSNYYEAELSQLPDIEADEKNCQVFLTKVDGDIEHNNFISSLKKIK